MGFGDSGAVLNRLRRLPCPFHPLCLSYRQQTDLRPGAYARQAIGRHGQDKHLVHALETAHHHLAHATHCLGPAEALFDPLALPAGVAAIASGTDEQRPDVFCAT